MTITSIFVILMIVAFYARVAYLDRKSKRDSFMKKVMMREINELVYECFFKEEIGPLYKSYEFKDNALLRIKAIFDHLGVKVEIVEDEIIPSIDTFRSLSFVKEYLPEIDEQLKIHKKFNRSCDEYWNKCLYYAVELTKIISPNKWIDLSTEQKKEMIHELTKKYDIQCKQDEDQENLTE